MFNGGDAQLVELLIFAYYSKMAEIESKFKFRRGFQKQTCFHYEAREEVKTLKILVLCETLKSASLSSKISSFNWKQTKKIPLCPGASTMKKGRSFWYPEFFTLTQPFLNIFGGCKRQRCSTWRAEQLHHWTFFEILLSLRATLWRLWKNLMIFRDCHKSCSF